MPQLSSPPAFADLQKQLADADYKVRLAAASLICSHYRSQALSPLLGLLSDERAAVRTYAVRELGKLKDTRAVVPLLGLLVDPSAGVRTKVIEALGRLKSSQSTGALLNLLRDPAENIRIKASESLARLRDPQAVLPLTALLNDPLVNVQLAAIRALRQLKDKRATSALLPLLQSPHEAIIWETAVTLGFLRDESAIDALLEMIKNDSLTLGTTYSAFFALGKIGGDLALGKLLQLYRGEIDWRDWRVRVLYVFHNDLKGNFGQWYEEIIALALAALQAKEDVRIEAIHLLSVVREPRAIEPLCALFNDPLPHQNLSFPGILVNALAEIGGEEVLTILLQWLETYPYPSTLVPALGHLGDPRAVEPLLRLLDSDPAHPYSHLQLHVMYALASLGDPRAREPLAAFQAHPLPTYREGARYALGKLRKK